MFFPVEWCVKQCRQYEGDIVKYSDKHIITEGRINIQFPVAMTNVRHYITTRDAKLAFIVYFL